MLTSWAGIPPPAAAQRTQADVTTLTPAPAQPAPSAESDDAVRAMRADAPALVMGIVLMALGIVGIALFTMQRRWTDLTLFYFAIFVGLYGLRLCVYTATLSYLVGASAGTLARIDAVITYTINLPMALFVERLLGPGWRRSLTLFRQTMTVFALVGLTVAAGARDPRSLMTANNMLVIGGILILVAHYRAIRAVASPAGFRAIALGIGALGVLALNNNLAGLGLLPWGEGPEAVGFVAFIAALGYVVARRQIEAGRQLIAIDQELRTARSIQESILPRQVPQLDGLDVSARYVPMTAIGGDFYEFLSLDRHRLGVLVADVSGHGVPAALIASMVKVAISALAQHADSPARVLAGMNQVLCGKLERQFVTASYVFVDLQRGRILSANAGHPPALLWRGGQGPPIELKAAGIMMGILADSTYEEVEQAIGDGDRILLYTDGIIEARNASGDFFDPDGLRRFAADHSDLSADAFGTALLDYLATWSGQPADAGFEDDVTLVSLRVTKPEG